MNHVLVALAAVVLGAQPAAGATLEQARMSGVVTGEALCSLVRHGAPKEVFLEEFDRISERLTKAEVLNLEEHGDAYLEVIGDLLRSCPERGGSER